MVVNVANFELLPAVLGRFDEYCDVKQFTPQSPPYRSVRQRGRSLFCDTKLTIGRLQTIGSTPMLLADWVRPCPTDA